ncbi:YfkD family protein [Pseudogracilibacillus sp. SE30717A]|uniref:YfkD family protein n=1 Tax=Pseudogracilibacillus sp. SE30717A TaxID=3098293 RepID=UPI00300DCE60
MMKKCLHLILSIGFIFCTMLFLTEEYSAEKKSEKQTENFTLPKNVISLSKSNTFPNTTEDMEVIEPSNATKELLDAIDIQIENPELIKLLNESSIKPSPIAIGYRAKIYLGRWPLNYQSENTSVIWDYQLVNENNLSNVAGHEVQEMRYIQQEQSEVKGALTNKIENPSVIKKMMLMNANEKTNLPLSFSTVLGKNSKLDNYYNVPIDKNGSLKAYSPAINEKGKVTFGEVYIELKGHTKEIEIKNVTKQGIGAWIPIQDHISLSFQLK